MNSDARTPHWDITELWDDYRPTPLICVPALARRAGVAQVLIKCEGDRPLGNFKALGGLYAGLRALARAIDADSLHELQDRRHRVRDLRLVCASDGNHGLAVAAAAARAGASASIYLPSDVDATRARRIVRLGAEVVRVYGTYDDAVDAATAAARHGNGLLIADTSDDPDDPVVADVMAGYGLLLRELREQLDDHGDGGISHAFVQAGVGGLAAAVAEGLHARLHGPARLLVVEPANAACVALALSEGRPRRLPGDLHTSADMLSCGQASAPAIALLQRYGAGSIVVSEDALRAAAELMHECGGPRSTASGAAGLAGLLHVAGDATAMVTQALSHDSKVLLIATERPPH